MTAFEVEVAYDADHTCSIVYRNEAPLPDRVTPVGQAPGFAADDVVLNHPRLAPAARIMTTTTTIPMMAHRAVRGRFRRTTTGSAGAEVVGVGGSGVSPAGGVSVRMLGGETRGHIN